MTGPLLALALAAGPEILVPPWPLSPDGELVAVRGAAPLSADGAAVEAAGPGLFRVVPAPGAARVLLSAGDARAEAGVEPPPGTVEVVVRPPAPVKGRDGRAEVELTVRRADGTPDAAAEAPVLTVSGGRIEELAPAGPGRYRGVYVPAAARRPEVAVLLAVVPRCPLCPTPRAVGRAIVPLAAAIDLPGEAEPGTRTSLVVAGRTFGPVTADAGGRFAVPIVVPPGARFGEATTVDQLGNRSTKRVDLALPAVDLLACAAWPRAIPADGRSEASVWCVASTDAGEPAAEARITIASSAGAVSRLSPAAGGLQHARLRAPRGGGGRDAVLRAAFPEGGPTSVEEVRIGLATGAPAELAASVEREPVPRGAAVPAVTRVLDARGDVLGPASGPAGAEVGFVTSDRFVAGTTGTSQDAPLAFALAPGGPAATLALWHDGSSWVAAARTVDARPAAGVPLRFGGGATATTDARGEASPLPRPAARGGGGPGTRAAGPAACETVTGPGGVRAAGWAGVTPPPAPFEVSRTVTVALRPPSAVDVRAEVAGGAVRWRVEDPEGRPLPGRRVVLRAEGVVLGPAERDGDGGRAAIRSGAGRVAVVDGETGVAALVEVREVR
jgi:hypothetical protein